MVLDKAIPLLQQRIAAIDAETALKEWDIEANLLHDKSDELYRKLEKLYRPFLQQMLNLMVEIFSNDIAFSNRPFNSEVQRADFWR